MSDIMMAAVVTAAVIIALASAIAAAVMYMKQRRVMDSIEEMLETARKGSFTEHDFDESRFSALENRFADYLATSEISAQRVKSEKDKIKTLIADISHQTKTPIAKYGCIRSCLTRWSCRRLRKSALYSSMHRLKN